MLFNLFNKVGTVILVVAILLVAGYATANYFSTKTYTVMVTEKTVKNYEKGSVFLVFTKLENKSTRVFAVQDSFFKFRWNSADVYADIQEGQSYQFEVIGWRVPFCSMYENIIKVSPRNNS